MKPDEATRSLESNGFKVEDKRPERDYLIAKCGSAGCHQRWSVGIRDGEIHVGNVLTLMNHARSHGAKS